MTDITHRSAPALPETSAVRPWPFTPYVVIALAGAAGLIAGRALGSDPATFEDGLLRLLRFMAVLKLAGVLGAAGLVHWRLARGIAWPMAASYAAALAVMAFATGLIWSLAIIAGAVLFHVGLLAFLLLAWRDDGVGMRLPGRR